METLSIILKLVQPKMFTAKLDIKDAYYNFGIKEEQQKLFSQKCLQQNQTLKMLITVFKSRKNIKSYFRDLKVA